MSLLRSLFVCVTLGLLSSSASAELTNSTTLGQGGSHWASLVTAWTSAFTASTAWTSAYKGSFTFQGDLDEDARRALPSFNVQTGGNVSFVVTDLPLTQQEQTALNTAGGSIYHLPSAVSENSRATDVR
jgi:hypothetical protein